ncbi:MAG: (2Fe-2S) ferredoxin domain-containing protein [Candidatus Accumulibacter sp.]|nr:(2Fe-2S) ferredoxin domain-containing protein [Accumulibacter sp.]
MSHYEHHVFFCCHQKADGRNCCNKHGASGAQAYAKERVAGLPLKERQVRVNKAGCLGRCDEGPLLVIYPEAVWYRYADTNDVDEIIREHLGHGRVVERLRI